MVGVGKKEVGTQEWSGKAKNKNRITESYDELHKSFTNTFGNVESSSDIPAIK